MNISLQRSLLVSNFGLFEFEDRKFFGFQSPWIFSSQNSRVPCFVDSLFSSLEISPHRFTSKFALFFLQTSTKSKSFQQIYKSINYIFFPFFLANFFKFIFFFNAIFGGKILAVSGPYQGRIRPKTENFHFFLWIWNSWVLSCSCLFFFLRLISIFFCGFGIPGF